MKRFPMEQGQPSRTALGAASHRAAHQVLERGFIFAVSAGHSNPGGRRPSRRPRCGKRPAQTKAAPVHCDENAICRGCPGGRPFIRSQPTGCAWGWARHVRLPQYLGGTPADLCSAPTGAFAGVAGERSDAVAARSWRSVLFGAFAQIANNRAS